MRRHLGLKLLLCAMALGLSLASSTSAQVVEGYIQLPDSFGIFRAPYEIAWDYTPGAERLFVVGESSDVLVIDAINFRKLARIPGPANSLCYSSTHNKLYVAQQGGCTVVDGSTYQVIKHLQFGDIAGWLFYNPIVDRVYCGTYHWRIIDCDSDSVVDMIEMDGWGACRAFDSLHNKLYVGTGLALKVVDCYSDSVVAAVSRVRGATAICYNPTSDRVYATANTGGTWPDETLYVVDTKTDSVVAQLVMPRPARFRPTLTMCCDPVRNRVFTACTTTVVAVDCTADTILWWNRLGGYYVACVPAHKRVYVARALETWTLDGSSGDVVTVPTVDGRAAPLVYLERLNRLYLLANWGQLAAIDCGIDTAIGTVPLDAFVDRSVERVCLDTVDNKLYFAFNQNCGYIGVADCSAGLVESHKMGRYPDNMVHDALDNKLYFSTWNGSDRSGVSVFDCTNDSLIKAIPTGYVKGGLRWHPELNKVYGGTSDTFFGQDNVVVIDCAADSVIRTLARGNQDDALWYSLLSTESNQFWGFSPHGYTVVDCGKDSIVMDTLMNGWHYPMGVCYSESDRKVYVAHGSSELVVLSMKSLRPTRRIQLTGAGHAVDAMIHVAAAGKVYVAVMNGPSDTDTVYVVDTGADSVVSRFDAGHIIRAMCDDATGRYVYCTALVLDSFAVARETLLVIDTQCDSIVSGASLPGLVWGGGEWLLPNRRTGRIYVGQDLNGKLLVIRDSVVIGVEEWRDVTDPPAALQTVVNRAVPFRSAARADLCDASGRRAAVLRSGPNDISHLAPGVYFCRQTAGFASSAERSAVTKVVVTR